MIASDGFEPEGVGDGAFLGDYAGFVGFVLEGEGGLETGGGGGWEDEGCGCGGQEEGDEFAADVAGGGG